MSFSFAETGSRNSELSLVFLHGIGGGRSVFEPQLEYFASKYRCLAWDMPGYGGSPALEETCFAALSAALDDFLDQQVVENPVLIGHSIGGMVAQEWVARYSTVLSGLVLYATSPAFGRSDGDFQKRFIAERLSPIRNGRSMPDLAEEIVESLIGQSVHANVRARAVQCMSAVPESVYADMMKCLVTFERRRDLGNIACPTLVLAGDKDTNAPAAMMKKMADRIPGAQFACVDDAGHLINLEQPDQFNRIVESFLLQLNPNS
ncbi:MAG: 3-oxoadipate enol-lactonase [Parasphingorhabdus sp.]|jgi:3-oxoadipate enol-lactonase